MAKMSIAMQRRIGALPKTGNGLGNVAQPGYYGYDAGFRGNRRPTPIAEGMFGIGAVNYYGNDEGQQDLAAPGFYGVTDEEDGMTDAYLNGHYLQGKHDTQLFGKHEESPSVADTELFGVKDTVMDNKYLIGAAAIAAYWFFLR